jgi:hypothetical protein
LEAGGNEINYWVSHRFLWQWCQLTLLFGHSFVETISTNQMLNTTITNAFGWIGPARLAQEELDIAVD